MTRAGMLAGLKAGRVVECNVRGRVFRATLLARTADGWSIAPQGRSTYHHVTARDITAADRVWTPEGTQKLA